MFFLLPSLKMSRHIKVVETDFKRPLRSSFRAKKGERRFVKIQVKSSLHFVSFNFRISAVLFDSDPVVLRSPTETKLQLPVAESKIKDPSNEDAKIVMNEDVEDTTALSEQDFVKLNFGLRSKIRRDSLDKPPLKYDGDRDVE